MRTGGVVQHQIDDHPDTAPVRRFDQTLEIVVCAIVFFDGVVVDDIVAVVTGCFCHRHQPDAGRAQIIASGWIAVVDVVEFLDQPIDVADAVAVAVVERANEDFVAHRSIPPSFR
jgi:hypothetical protein